MATRKAASGKRPNLFKVSGPDGGAKWVNLAYLRKVEQIRIAGLKGTYPSLVFAQFEVPVVRPEEIRKLAEFLHATPEELTS